MQVAWHDPEASHYKPICHNAVFRNVVRGFSLVQVAWHDPEGSHYRSSMQHMKCRPTAFLPEKKGFQYTGIWLSIVIRIQGFRFGSGVP